MAVSAVAPAVADAPDTALPNAAPPDAAAGAVPASLPGAVKAAADQPDPFRPQSGELSVTHVDYDDKGAVVLKGSASPGKKVRVRLDGEPLGEATADAEGQWNLTPEQTIATGRYELQAEEVGSDGTAAAKVALPFAKADNVDDLPKPDRLVVQPGNNLWRLAERIYGHGLEYERIFEANRDQIEDPDLIYPGQIFQVPPAPPPPAGQPTE